MNVISEAVSKMQMFCSSVESKEQLKREFERVAMPELSPLYRSALYLTKDNHEAEDLVQETFLRAFRFFHKFQAGTNIRAWLLSIQRNLFNNRYRQKKREPEYIDQERIDEAYNSLVAKERGPESFLMSQSMDERIEQTLKQLPLDFRMAIVLVDIQDLKYEEAAEVMGCPLGTVRSRVSRGRRMLQVALRDYALETGLIRE